MAKARAKHILVKSKDECEKLKKNIEGGADFDKIAKEHSHCPLGKQGGDLGEFGPGQMVREFDTVVFTGELDKIHGPIKTEFGYHLIKIITRS